MLKIYHLEPSRSERIVWLAEEMGLSYQLIKLERDPKTHRAPEKLKEINPLGRAPAIEDGEVKLAESGAIVSWMLEKYGAKTAEGSPLRPSPRDPEFPAYLHWLFAGESTLTTTPVMDILTQMAGARSALLEDMLKKDYALVLNLLEEILAKQDYVAGSFFTAADIMVAFPLRMMAVKEVFEGVELFPELSDYPAIMRYLKRLHERPAFKRALAKIQG
ncbi:glutathione S-transferase [Acetobacteraceae bacterium]|nr:glutathione S-transferase [Acetobacteraceae bacterium]